MGLDQIWVGPNMGPTKYAGPNLVRPKMADQKCLDQIWLDTNKSRCCYNQDAVVLFRLSNLGAFVFEFTLDAVIIKSAVVFAPIR